MAASGVGGLMQRVDHQPRDQFVAAVHGGIPVGTVVTNLGYQILLRQPLQHGHHRGVGQVASLGERLVHLANGLRVRSGPEVIHHRALEISESRQLSHVCSSPWATSLAYSRLLLIVVPLPADAPLSVILVRLTLQQEVNVTIVIDDPLISAMTIERVLPLHESSRRLRELYPQCPRVYGVAVLGDVSVRRWWPLSSALSTDRMGAMFDAAAIDMDSR